MHQISPYLTYLQSLENFITDLKATRQTTLEKQSGLEVKFPYLVADLVDDHHGQLHLIGRRRHLGVQQDLLLHEDAQAPVLHGGVGMFGHRQQVCKTTHTT